MNMKKIIVVTGGCGFIGHHFAEYIHKNTDWEIIIFDKLTYASMGLNRLRNNKLLESNRVKVYTIDLCVEIAEGIKKEIGTDINYIVHMAAETHVDNSISDPELFIKNNVMSTFNMLEYARELGSSLKFFFNFSTDEVYGDIETGHHIETDLLKPSNPYSATKAALHSLSNSLAKEFSTFNITSNTIALSPFPTDMLNTISQKDIDWYLNEQKIKRLATIDDITNVVEFFSSEKSAFITAQFIQLGGIST